MERLRRLFYQFLEGLLVLTLAGMCVMVFTNVVLRYGFNQGLVVSEEMARFFFVWLTFIGAVLTFREGAHIGIETVVQRLSRRGRLVCMFLSNVLIMVCGAIFCLGAWQQLEINATMYAPVTGLSLAWVYGIGMFTGTGVFLIALSRTYEVATGKVKDEDIAKFAGDLLPDDVAEALKGVAK